MWHYIGLIHKDTDSDYGVSFPDLPGIATAGTTLDDARAMATEALALHLEGLAADGEAVPEPSSLEDIMRDEANRDGVAVLIAAPSEAVKACASTLRFRPTCSNRLTSTPSRTASAGRAFWRWLRGRPWLREGGSGKAF